MAYDGRPDDLMRAVTAIRDCHAHYLQAEAYYRGRVAEVFGSQFVARTLSKSSADFNVNFAKRVVDAVLDRVEIAALTVGDDEALSQRLRDEVWNANRMGRYSKKVHWASLVYGDAYLFAWPTNDGDNDGDEGPVGVDLQYNSPLTTRVFYEAENPKVKAFAAKVWVEYRGGEEGVRDGDPSALPKLTRVNLYYADRIERYISKSGTKGDQSTEYEPYGDDGEPWPLPNEYGEIPVFHFRTDDPYGRPEHEPAYGAQNAITKTIATEMDVMEQEAFPSRYILTKDPIGMVNTSAASYQRVGDTSDEDDKNPRDRQSPFQSGPGKWSKFVGADTVGQLDAAETTGFSDLIDHFLRLMSSATGTPMHSLHPVGDMPSGEALRAAEAPLAVRIQDREEWWEETWADALVFAGKIVGLPITNVDIQWKPVQIVDDQEGWATAMQKRGMGVPVPQILKEMGYLSALVDQWESEGLFAPKNLDNGTGVPQGTPPASGSEN